MLNVQCSMLNWKPTTDVPIGMIDSHQTSGIGHWTSGIEH
jgi:hypothetical protein